MGEDAHGTDRLANPSYPRSLGRPGRLGAGGGGGRKAQNSLPRLFILVAGLLRLFLKLRVDRRGVGGILLELLVSLVIQLENRSIPLGLRRPQRLLIGPGLGCHRGRPGVEEELIFPPIQLMIHILLIELLLPGALLDPQTALALLLESIELTLGRKLSQSLISQPFQALRLVELIIHNPPGAAVD